MDNSTLTPGSNDFIGSTDSMSGGYPGTVPSGVGSTASKPHSAASKAADPAHETVDRLSAAAHQTVDKIAVGAADAAERLSCQARRMNEASSHALESSKSWVQSRPLEAVGVALALGFIMGRMMSSR